MGVIADKIRRAIFGGEVRDSIADGIEVVEQLREDYDNQVINAGNSNAEIVDARGNYAKLKERLDKEHGEVISQLDTIEFKKMNNGDSISVTQIDKNKGKFDETYFTDEFLSQMAGNTPISSTIADEGATSEKIAKKAVKGRHITEELFNIINGYDTKGNKIKWEIGSIDGSGNNMSGSNRIRSEFILINEGVISLADYINYGINIVIYDLSFNKTSATQWIKKDTYISTPCYIRVLIKKADESIIGEGEIETIGTALNIKNIPLASKSVIMSKLSDEIKGKMKYSFTNGDSFKWELGTLNNDGDVEAANNRMRVTDFIKMKNGIIGLKDYSKYRLNVISYNEAKTKVTATHWVKNDVTVSNVSYVKMMIVKIDDGVITEDEIKNISNQCFVYFDDGLIIGEIREEIKDIIKATHSYGMGTKYLLLHKWEVGSVNQIGELYSTIRLRSEYIRLNKGDTITFDSSIYKMGGHIYNLSDKSWIKDIGWQSGSYVVDRDCYFRMVSGLKTDATLTVNDKYNFLNTLKLTTPINTGSIDNIVNIDINNDINYLYSPNNQIKTDSVVLNSGTNEINYIEINTVIPTNTQIAIIELNARLIDETSKSTISLFRDTTKAFEVSIDATYFKPYILKIPCHETSTFAVKIGSLLTTNLAKCEIKDIVIKFESIVKKQNSNDNLIYIAHRGDTKFAPENTFPAFMEAKLKGFNAIETDVEITSDNEFVLLHDDTIDRTSDGTGKINALTLSQVKTFDFGSWKDTKYRGTTIPTLEEFLIWCKMTDIKPVLELKNAFTTEQANKFITLLKDTGMWGEADIISFKIEVLKSIADIDNSCRFALIGTATYENIEQLKTIGSNIYFSILWGDLGTAVYRCKLNNIDYIYSTDDGNTIRQCYKLGCSAICTNMVILNECCM